MKKVTIMVQFLDKTGIVLTTFVTFVKNCQHPLEDFRVPEDQECPGVDRKTDSLKQGSLDGPGKTDQQ